MTPAARAELGVGQAPRATGAGAPARLDPLHGSGVVEHVFGMLA